MQALKLSSKSAPSIHLDLKMSFMFPEDMKKINQEREEIIDKKMLGIEQQLKEIEMRLSTSGQLSSGKKIFFRYVYKQFEKVDSLFIKAEDLDDKSVNLIYDEIEDQILHIKTFLNVFEKHVFKREKVLC